MLPPELLDQLTALNLQHREIVGMLNQLSRPSEITSQPVLDELASKIKAAFAQADRAIENVEWAVETEDNPRNKDEGQVYIAKVAEDFTFARASFRKLLLQASKTLNQRRLQQASAAVFSPQTPVNGPIETNAATSPRLRIPTNTPNTSEKDASLTAANDVTIALKRTHALLEQELEKSTLSLDSLNSSSQTLRQLENQYGAFDVLLRGSRRLIIELERADKWDRWMIYGGLAIFGLACLWIVYKRILRGPLGLVFWASTKALGLGSAFARPREVAVVGKTGQGRLVD